MEEVEKGGAISNGYAPNFILDRPWMVKVTVWTLVGTTLSTLLGAFSNMADTRYQYSALAAWIVTSFILLFGGFEALVAWGLWQLKK